MIAHAHHRTFAELFFNLAQGCRQGALLILVHLSPHVIKKGQLAATNNCISRQYYSTGQVARLPRVWIFLRKQAQQPSQRGLNRLSANFAAVPGKLPARTE